MLLQSGFVGAWSGGFRSGGSRGPAPQGGARDSSAFFSLQATQSLESLSSRSVDAEGGLLGRCVYWSSTRGPGLTEALV